MRTVAVYGVGIGVDIHVCMCVRFVSVWCACWAGQSIYARMRVNTGLIKLAFLKFAEAGGKRIWENKFLTFTRIVQPMNKWC